MTAPGRIDCHTHLLPFVDDGCRDHDDSEACARRLIGNGYTHAVCTSHCRSDWDPRPPEQVRAEVADLQRHFDERGIPLTLLPGGELSMMHSVEHLRRGDLTPLGNGNALLFDLWAPGEPDFFYPCIEHLKDMGLQPVLAHPERIEFIARHGSGHRTLGDGQVDRLAEAGVLLQCNLASLAGTEGSDAREQSRRWLKEGRYHLLASDTHRPETMDQRMRGLQVALEIVGADGVKQLTQTNPAALLDV